MQIHKFCSSQQNHADSLCKIETFSMLIFASWLTPSPMQSLIESATSCISYFLPLAHLYQRLKLYSFLGSTYALLPRLFRERDELGLGSTFSPTPLPPFSIAPTPLNANKAHISLTASHSPPNSLFFLRHYISPTIYQHLYLYRCSWINIAFIAVSMSIWASFTNCFSNAVTASLIFLRCHLLRFFSAPVPALLFIRCCPLSDFFPVAVSQLLCCFYPIRVSVFVAFTFVDICPSCLLSSLFLRDQFRLYCFFQAISFLSVVLSPSAGLPFLNHFYIQAVSRLPSFATLFQHWPHLPCCFSFTGELFLHSSYLFFSFNVALTCFPKFSKLSAPMLLIRRRHLPCCLVVACFPSFWVYMHQITTVRVCWHCYKIHVVFKTFTILSYFVTFKHLDVAKKN